jgi:uncharacterized protein YbaA (DUF1428 family)
MSYVDGYVLPLPESKLEEYRKMADKAGAIWKEHGALEYKECIAEDTTDTGFCGTFPKLFATQPGEVVVFAYVVYRDRAHRDEVNAKVMNDPRIKDDCHDMPFDPMRMAYGGFRSLVEY